MGALARAPVGAFVDSFVEMVVGMWEPCETLKWHTSGRFTRNELSLIQVSEARDSSARICDSRPRCFGADSAGADGAAGLLAALARCPELEDTGIH